MSEGPRHPAASPVTLDHDMAVTKRSPGMPFPPLLDRKTASASAWPVCVLCPAGPLAIIGSC
jgi:hypothetical protein